MNLISVLSLKSAHIFGTSDLDHHVLRLCPTLFVKDSHFIKDDFLILLKVRINNVQKTAS